MQEQGGRRECKVSSGGAEGREARPLQVAAPASSRWTHQAVPQEEDAHSQAWGVGWRQLCWQSAPRRRGASQDRQCAATRRVALVQGWGIGTHAPAVIHTSPHHCPVRRAHTLYLRSLTQPHEGTPPPLQRHISMPSPKVLDSPIPRPSSVSKVTFSKAKSKPTPVLCVRGRVDGREWVNE